MKFVAGSARRSPSRYEASPTTVKGGRKLRWQPSGPTTLRRGPRSSGTSIIGSVTGSGLTGSKHPTNRLLFVKGQVANAEPAVPGWRIALDDIFVS